MFDFFRVFRVFRGSKWLGIFDKVLTNQLFTWVVLCGTVILKPEGFLCMKTIPKFTEATIRDRIDSRSFERGQQYFRENAIYNTRKQDLTVKGESEGSSGGP